MTRQLLHTGPVVAGQNVGNYRIVDRLGEGGVGEVYLAEHPEIGRKVAIKFLRRALAADPTVYGRFVDEARAASAIQHSNIVEVLDFGRLPDGQPYIVMEYLPGESLAARLRRVGQLRVRHAVEIAFQIANVLTAAHDKGIVHRDLKPDNVFLVPDRRQPGREIVKVLDFGIAKLQGDLKHSEAHTRTGSLVGTPLYMSPEQCRGIREIDARTDIYALGAMLFEMLAGRPPFVSQGLGDLMDMHMNRPAPSVRSLARGVPKQLDAVVTRALAKLPEHRFPNGAAFQAALEAAPRRTHDGQSTPAIDAPLLTSGPELPAAGSAAATTDEIAAAALGLRRARHPLVRGVVIAATAAATMALGSWIWPMGAPGDADPRRHEPAAAASPRGGDSPSRGPAAARAPTAETQSPSAPAAASAAADPAPATITWRIDSQPPEATVTDARTREVLGTSPLTLSRPRSDGVMELRLSKRGFRVATVRLSLARDASETITLTRQPSPTRPPATAGLEDL
jgi:serine/threonine-protein kinase